MFILEFIPVILNPRSTLDAWCSSLAGLANSNTTGRALDLVAPHRHRIVAVLDMIGLCAVFRCLIYSR